MHDDAPRPLPGPGCCRPDRHPCHRVRHDGHPVTHQHREHAINDNDRDIIDVIVDEFHDEQQSITVADLLDAYGNLKAYRALSVKASHDVIRSADRIADSLAEWETALARLSSEERAEFDRRTT